VRERQGRGGGGDIAAIAIAIVKAANEIQSNPMEQGIIGI